MIQIDPKNVSAQMTYRAAGNSPATQPITEIGNFFPGLELDFRNIWRNLFVGVQLHEADWRVVRIEPGSTAAAAGVTTSHVLTHVNGQQVFVNAVTPDGNVAGVAPTEWSNTLADIVLAIDSVDCRFAVFSQQTGAETSSLTVRLVVRPVFEEATLARPLAQPGELTQSLCSPWQADYRECGCFYWAASRPDFINVEVVGGQAQGHSWMQKHRTPTTPKVYLGDETADPSLVTYEDLYRAWEQHLKFIVEGKDKE